MGQDAVLLTIATFGPCSSKALKGCLRQKHAAIGESLKVLQRTGEIGFMPAHENESHGVWVAV